MCSLLKTTVQKPGGRVHGGAHLTLGHKDGQTAPRALSVMSGYKSPEGICKVTGNPCGG